jgi:hypothetical protein
VDRRNAGVLPIEPDRANEGGVSDLVVGDVPLAQSLATLILQFRRNSSAVALAM